MPSRIRILAGSTARFFYRRLPLPLPVKWCMKSFPYPASSIGSCSDLQSKIGKPAIKGGFQPTLSAADGLQNRHYLQLNLQSAGSDLQSPLPNRHYLQLKWRPETHLIVPNLDVVFWTGFLDGGKP